MVKRFWVFILLLLSASVVSAQDMPPLPSDAPASAAPAKDSGMPALPDASAPSASAVAAPGANDMPALPDANAPAAAAKSAVAPAVNDMPALPDASAPASPAKPAAAAPAASNDMPALPDAGGSAPAPAAAPAASAPKAAASPENSDMNSVPVDDGGSATAAPAKESKPWMASKERPKTIFGGWIHAKGGNITSRLSWASQQVLNAMDTAKYKMGNEEGVYEGEQNKGPQYRKFTFIVPKTQDTVLVLLKESKGKVWLRVGPDEEPAPADHTYAQVAKIRAEDQRVLAILKKKFGLRVGPHRYVPSWDAPFNRHKETADE